MKIAYIGQKGIPCRSGGVEKHVEDLATKMAARGHNVFVYSRKHYVAGAPQNFQGVNLIYTPTINTKHLDAIIHTFTATVHALFQGFDIVHYHAIGPSFLSFIPRWLLGRTKVIATFHCQDWTHKKWNKFSQACLKAGAWMSVHAPHKTIAISRLLQEYCAVQYDREVEYIPYGVPEPKECPPRLIAQKYNLKKDGYVLAVSRLVPHKQIHTLIKAWREVDTEKSLVIVGGSSFTPQYERKLQELAATDQRVILAGEQSGQIMAEFFSNAYAFTQPSESEGLPIAVLEAMSYGLGIVASDIPEHLEGAGQAALYFHKNDQNDLREQLQKAIDDPKLVARRGLQAKKRVEQYFHWDNLIEQIEQLYQNCHKEDSPQLAFAKK